MPDFFHWRWIGWPKRGRSDDSRAGRRHQFVSGFYRLYSYLDTPDGYDDNTGSFSVTVSNSFSDSLAQGINPAYWVLRTNTSLFTISTNGGDLAFSKPQGEVNSSIQYATLASLLVARGNFNVQVDFTNASIALVSGSPGNQIQLNTRFGGQNFLMVRER